MFVFHIFLNCTNGTKSRSMNFIEVNSMSHQVAILNLIQSLSLSIFQGNYRYKKIGLLVQLGFKCLRTAEPLPRDWLLLMTKTHERLVLTSSTSKR